MIGDSGSKLTQTSNGKHGQDFVKLSKTASAQTGITIVKQHNQHLSMHAHQMKKVTEQTSCSHKQLAFATSSILYSQFGGEPPSSNSQQVVQPLRTPTKFAHASKGVQPSYQMTTEVLSARQLLQSEQKQQQQAQVARQNEKLSSGKKQQNYVGGRLETFPRVMQREKRQNKYQVKQSAAQKDNQGAQMQETESAALMAQYQPLRCQQQPYGRGQIAAREQGYCEQGAPFNQDSRGKKRNKQSSRKQDNAQFAAASNNDEIGAQRILNVWSHTRDKNQMAFDGRAGVPDVGEKSLAQVKVYNTDESKVTRFEHHPVHAFKGSHQSLQQHNKSGGRGGASKAIYVPKNSTGFQSHQQRANAGLRTKARAISDLQQLQTLQSQPESCLNPSNQLHPDSAVQKLGKQNAAHYNNPKIRIKGAPGCQNQQFIVMNDQIQTGHLQNASSQQAYAHAMQGNPSQPYYEHPLQQTTLRYNGIASSGLGNYYQAFPDQSQEAAPGMQNFVFTGADPRKNSISLHSSAHQQMLHLQGSSFPNPSQPHEPNISMKHSGVPNMHQQHQPQYLSVSAASTRTQQPGWFSHQTQQQQMFQGNTWMTGPSVPAHTLPQTLPAQSDRFQPEVMGISQNMLQASPMQIVSKPLRLKTQQPSQASQQQPAHCQQPISSQQHVAQSVTQTTAPMSSQPPIAPQDAELNCREGTEVGANEVEPSNQSLSHPKVERVSGNQDLNMTGVKINASTESAEASEIMDNDAANFHEQTFQCLCNQECTKWFLLAQVGNSQIKIPASALAFKFSENAQELPILTKDCDLIERVVRLEESLASSAKPVTQLNRPTHAGYNPSSSNNISNNGYRKKENVQQAQRDYDNKMKLSLVGDQECDKLHKLPLYLPIENSSHDATTRIVDLYLHQRTQQLMCIEFDLTHLKLDESDSSYSGEYSDNFTINHLSSSAPEQAANEPTPFMGLPKNQGYAFGQPQNVLYINKSQDNDVARKLRVINQDYVDQVTYLKLNGECHGKLVFEQDLKYQVQGKKVIKSIQERLIRAKDHIYNEIVRLEPGIIQRNVSQSSSSKSRETKDRHSRKPQQRTQKSILSSLRGRNKRNKGPYLRRPDEIHIPIVNVTKSLGFKMLMSNLASIDNMLTNFNQIVMQEGLIQSFFFSFDLPAHQLSTASPAISNNLVVKVPKEIIAHGQNSSQHQAAYLAYQQHQAAMTQNHEQSHLLATQNSPVKNHQIHRVAETNQDAAQSTGSKQEGQLWDLVGEFKKISSQETPTQLVQKQPNQAFEQVAQKRSQPFVYHKLNDQPFVQMQAGNQGQSSPYRQASSNSNVSSAVQQPVFLSQISSFLSGPSGHALHQGCGVSSSQNSNLSQQPPCFQPYNGGFSQMSPLQPQMNGQLIQHGEMMQQQLHQALFSLREQFPDQHPMISVGSGSYNGQLSHLEQPAYVAPEDPNYMSNLDRLLEAMTPRVNPDQLEKTSVKDFFKSFRQTSVFGLRVELLNEQTLQAEIYTFTPTLSSLVLSYSKPSMLADSVCEKVNRVLNFDDASTKTDQEIAQSADCSKAQGQGNSQKSSVPPSTQKVESTSSVTTQLSKPQIKYIEQHEAEPHYLRQSLFQKIKDVVAEIPHLKQVFLSSKTFNFQSSWFSILWTCQKVCSVPSPGNSNGSKQDLGMEADQDSAKHSSSAVTNIQFLAIFRFRPEPSSLSKCQANAARDNNLPRPSYQSQPVQLIGLLPYKLERESFWVSPSHLQTDNNLQGEMYDQICEDNIILMQDLKQRAIEFLQPQASHEDMHDFTHLLNSTNSSIFDFI